MILFANFLGALARIIHVVLMIYMWVVIFRVIFSWISIPSLYSLAVILYNLTEPVMRPLRRMIPPNRLGGIDVTPIIIFLLILFVDSFLVKSLSLYAQQILRDRVFQF